MPKSTQTNEQLILDTIINHLPAMVFYKNLEGVYMAANNKFCKQLGTTPEQIVGKTDFDFYDRERALNYQQSDIQIISTGEKIEGFEEEITVEGEKRIYATRKVRIEDNEGKPTGIIGLVYDVTETNRIQEELLESRAKYKYTYEMFRLMADNMPDLLWAKDLKKKYLFANKAICDKLLIADDTSEPIGKTDIFFAKRERAKQPQNPAYHTFGEICSDSDEVIFKNKSEGKFEEYGNVRGQFIFLDVNKAPIIDSEGNMIGIVGSARDITKEKQIEKDLARVNERNKAILKALPDLMFLYDREGTFLDCYASDPEQLLAPADQVIGHNIAEFFSPNFVKNVKKVIINCISTKEVQTMEYELEVNGKINFYESRHSYVDENQVLSISRNITDRKQLQQEILAAKEKAEESDRLKSTLLNNMSHELRTPLNGILGFSEILTQELASSEYSEMAKHINNSGKRLMRTLDSIMQLSQLESGVNALNLQEAFPDKLFSQMMEIYLPQARSKGLYLELREVPSDQGFIDLFFFVQAITNILDNAIKFTREGGVSITVRQFMKTSQRFLSIIIEDTGIGITNENIQIIFDEFRQVSEGHNRGFEGTGIGLTIARKMILLMDGTIAVQSKIGKGTQFFIELPFPEQKQIPFKQVLKHDGETAETLNKGMVSSTQQIILLVEDNEVNMQLTHAYLKQSYQMDWAPDGPMAIEKAKRKKYSLILMDINLGLGMDGIQATQAIRKIPGYENVPIIALTGYTLFGDRERLIEGGCTGYLSKPFTKSEILKVLGPILNRS